MTTIVLFDNLSVGPDSPVFEVKKQVTVVAMGLQPGDSITFEVVKVTEGARAKICGCHLSKVSEASILGVQELQCPACEELTQRPVRLTPQNPVVVLDFPQNTLVRAIYNGEGLSLQTVRAWVDDTTSTQDLTPELRGCPPIFYADEDQTWADTGAFRCLADQETVEYQQVNDCGRYRWEPDLERGQVWVDTLNLRCLADQESIEIEQTNQCGDRRWQLSETISQDWQPTGTHRCTPDGRVELQETNQCGQRRWVDCGSVEWIETGRVRCLEDEVTVELEETNQCGHRRWAEASYSQEWEATGTTRCTSLGRVESQEINQCGDTRWVDTEAVEWTGTGTTRCTLAGRYEAQETNNCGNIRWVDLGPVEWTATGVLRCLADQVTVEAEETNQCGQRRWATTALSQNWSENGDERCVDNTVQRQEVNRCGDTRWVSYPAEFCGNSTHAVVSVVASPSSANEGTNFCWTVTLDSPVVGAPINLVGLLTGSETAAHGYANPTGSILEGEMSGQLCVLTIDDGDVEADLSLCLQLQSNPRLAGIPAPVCVTVLDNDGGGGEASVHDILSIVPVLDPITEGEQACWDVTLDSPVATVDLNINFSLSGSEQAIHNYGAPSLLIPVGSSTGQVCVATVDDTTDEPTRELCLTALTSSRIVGVPAASCIDVQDNDEPDVSDSVHTVISVTVEPPSGVEGTQFCWTVTLDSPVVNSPLNLVGLLTGAEQSARSYLNPVGSIAVGQTVGTLCVTTIDDADIEGTLPLCLQIQTGPRITAVPAPVCADVLDNDEEEPASLPLQIGGDCIIDNPSTGTSEFYVQFFPDGTMRQKKLFGIGYSVHQWLPAGESAGDYEVQVVDTSDGALNRVGPTRGTWHAISVLRDFRWQAIGPAPGGGYVIATFNLRRIGEGTPDATRTTDAQTYVAVNQTCP